MRDGRVARWLHIRQDRRAAHPGTDRSAWADGAGFPDGRWPFRTAWDGPSAQVGPFTPPPSRVWLPVGGTAGPSIARDGRGGVGAQAFLLGLVWSLVRARRQQLDECPALAGFSVCTGYLDPHATFGFWCCSPRAVSCEAVCLFDIGSIAALLRYVAQGTRLFLRTARFHFPAFPPFHPFSQARRPEARCPPPFRLQPTPPRRWLSWRSPSCIDAHVPEQGPSTATLPSFQLLRPWLPVLSVRSQAPPVHETHRPGGLADRI